MVALALSLPSSSVAPCATPSVPSMPKAWGEGMETSFAKHETRFAAPVDGCAVAGWLMAAFPGETAFKTARTFGVSERTAQNWLAGQKPSADALWAMVLMFGPAFIAAVAPRHPEWVATAVTMERKRRLEAERARIDQELAALGCVE